METILEKFGLQTKIRNENFLKAKYTGKHSYGQIKTKKREDGSLKVKIHVRKHPETESGSTVVYTLENSYLSETNSQFDHGEPHIPDNWQDAKYLFEKGVDEIQLEEGHQLAADKKSRYSYLG